MNERRDMSRLRAFLLKNCDSSRLVILNYLTYARGLSLVMRVDPIHVFPFPCTRP